VPGAERSFAYNPPMRVPRTFVFLDLSGFTNYTAAYGDEAAGRILSTFRTLVREVSSERGVRIAKWLGDGCMMVAVEQMAAIEFVMDLERRAAHVCAPLTLRAGIATGEALLFEGDDYIGSAVNMAARLCDLATNFDVLMPTMQLDQLPEGVLAEPYGEVTLRGFPGSVDLVRLTGAPTSVDKNDTSELWTRGRFF
jgi:adenylate cyclase